MLTFTVRLTRLRPPDVAKSQFNGWVRAGLVEAAKYWIANYLPLHFQRGAEQRYNYAPRTRRTHAIKARAAQRGLIYSPKGGEVPYAGPPAPWVWTGDAKQALLGRSPDSFNIRPTATSNTQKVVVPLPIGHPINPRHKGELTVVTRAERRKLTDIVLTTVKRLRFQNVLAKIENINANSAGAA